MKNWSSSQAFGPAILAKVLIGLLVVLMSVPAQAQRRVGTETVQYDMMVGDVVTVDPLPTLATRVGTDSRRQFMADTDSMLYYMDLLPQNNITMIEYKGIISRKWYDSLCTRFEALAAPPRVFVRVLKWYDRTTFPDHAAFLNDPDASFELSVAQGNLNWLSDGITEPHYGMLPCSDGTRNVPTASFLGLIAQGQAVIPITSDERLNGVRILTYLTVDRDRGGARSAFHSRAQGNTVGWGGNYLGNLAENGIGTTYTDTDLRMYTSTPADARYGDGIHFGVTFLDNQFAY